MMFVMAYTMVSCIMVSMFPMLPIVRMTPAFPISREKTPCGSEQRDEAYQIKDEFHMPNLSTY